MTPTQLWLAVEFLSIGLLADPLLPPGPLQFFQVLLFALIGAVVIASAAPLIVRLLARVLGIAPSAPPRRWVATSSPPFRRPCAAGSRSTARPRAPSGGARSLG